MSQTLFQKWVDKVRRANSPKELLYPNPAKVKIGATCFLDVSELRNLMFKVTQIRVYTRTIQGQDFTFTDYDLSAVNPVKKIRLRYMPQAEKTATGDDYRIMLLNMDEDHGYDKDEHAALKADTGEFEIFGDDEQLESRWWRVGDVRGAYFPLVVNIQDKNGDGVVQENEVSQVKMEYWDFNRQIKSIGGNDVVEFYIVEISGETGWIQTWRGPEIAVDQVSWQ